MIVRLPGNAYQTDLASYPGTAIENLKAYFDMRGLLLNIFPVCAPCRNRAFQLAAT